LLRRPSECIHFTTPLISGSNSPLFSRIYFACRLINDSNPQVGEKERPATRISGRALRAGISPREASAGGIYGIDAVFRLEASPAPSRRSIDPASMSCELRCSWVPSMERFTGTMSFRMGAGSDVVEADAPVIPGRKDAGSVGGVIYGEVLAIVPAAFAAVVRSIARCPHEMSFRPSIPLVYSTFSMS